MVRDNEEDLKVINYLTSQGEKYTFKEMWPRVMQARIDLLNEIQGINNNQAIFKFSEDEWSILEIANHILQSSERVLSVVEKLAINGTIEGVLNIDPPMESTKLSLHEIHGNLLERGLDLSSLTPNLPERPSTIPTWDHSVFGPLHARSWYLFQRLHDIDHMKQMQKNKIHPNYPK